MSLIIQVPQNTHPPLTGHKTKTTKKIDIKYVLNETDLIEIVLEYGIDLIEQVGGDYICLCPFHDDRDTPSMRIYTATNSWYCFGCRQGSSVFDFVMLSDQVDFQEALQKLAARLGYGNTYILREIRIDHTKGDRFSVVREKIESVLFKKYLYIYNSKKSLTDIESNEYKKIKEFWKWYDNAQVFFEYKIRKNLPLTILEPKLFEFYSCALQKLETLEEELCYVS